MAANNRFGSPRARRQRWASGIGVAVVWGVVVGSMAVWHALTVKALLVVIGLLLLAILAQLGNIHDRLAERFPTDEEQDSDWAETDPISHWEAHRKQGEGESHS